MKPPLITTRILWPNDGCTNWGKAWSQASQRALLPLNSDLNLALLLLLLNKPFYKFFSLMWSEAMQMCWNKRNFLQEKRVQSRRTFCVNQRFTILYINIIWKKENSKTRKLKKIPSSNTVKIMSWENNLWCI